MQTSDFPTEPDALGVDAPRDLGRPVQEAVRAALLVGDRGHARGLVDHQDTVAIVEHERLGQRGGRGSVVDE